MKRLILTASATLLLAGCNVAGSTYGTGKTQESQLVSDLASIVSFKKQKSEGISYEERPKLVKPSSTANLPAPIEVNRSESAFPVGPEGRRTVAAKPRIVREKKVDPNLSEEDRKYMNWTGPASPGYRRWASKRAKASKGSRVGVIKTTGKRRYLTQPPDKYRKTYDTAPVGEVGLAEDTKTFRKKSKGNIFSRLLGRG